MDSAKAPEHLSRISTVWSLVNQAHGGGPDTAPAAQRQLMQRYCGAVYHYLLGAVRNDDVAMDLFQEFALRFVRGDFRRADPGRGRFRDYVRKALIHLVTDYHRARNRQPEPLPADVADPVSLTKQADEDSEFLRSWREELISRTWQALGEAHPTLHAVLLYQAEHPGVTAAQMAQTLGPQLGKSISYGHLRVLLHRARKLFGELLRNEVHHSLESPDETALTEELRDLDLAKLVV